MPLLRTSSRIAAISTLVAGCAAPASAPRPVAAPAATMPEPVRDAGQRDDGAATPDRAVEAGRPEALPPIPPHTSVLLVGDSFVLAGFSQALRPRMKALDVRYEVKSEQASYTTTWASKMELLVQNYQPDLVIITLGANEVTNTDPPAHAYAVRRIVKSIGARPCVWVAPPLWRKDTGIMDVIRENSGPCRFFDTDAIVTAPIARQGDKIHPNREGGATWADAFWNWLQTERATPNDDVPVVAGKRSPWALRAAPADEHRPRATTGLSPHADAR